MAQLILALDVANRQKALALAEQMHGVVQWCKVGLELFISCGPDLLQELKQMGFHLFLDLKFYDIPNTVARAVARATEYGVEILTLHCQGGKRMCLAAGAVATDLKQTGFASPLLFGVTVLTSFQEGEMPGIVDNPAIFATQLADCASEWQLDGVVCSAWEVKQIKAQHPHLLCLCPGIRPSASTTDDQRRIATPHTAVCAGADFLVVGRPILEASDPVQAAQAILMEMTTEDDHACIRFQ